MELSSVNMRMSDWPTKTEILNETATCLGVSISREKTTLISNILDAMEARIPSHVWRNTPPEVLSALHLRNLINSDAIPPDSLNAKGWDALQFANEAIEDAKHTVGVDTDSG